MRGPAGASVRRMARGDSRTYQQSSQVVVLGFQAAGGEKNSLATSGNAQLPGIKGSKSFSQVMFSFGGGADE